MQGPAVRLAMLYTKDQDYSSRYYELAASNLLYMNKNGDDTYLQMAGNASNSYKKLSVVEKAIHGRTAAFFSCGMRSGSQSRATARMSQAIRSAMRIS